MTRSTARLTTSSARSALPPAGSATTGFGSDPGEARGCADTPSLNGIRPTKGFPPFPERVVRSHNSALETLYLA